MKSSLSKIIFCFIIALLVLIAGCAHTPPADEIQLSLKRKKSTDQQEVARAELEKARIEEVIKKIMERNKTIEDSHEWLKEAYLSLKIKNLNDIPKEDYRNYKKFLDNDTAYIIVHPAYYTFFQNPGILSSKEDAVVFPKKNLVERFYDKTSFFDRPLKILQEQERLLRDFIELMSTDEKLIIIILPRDYRIYLGCGYINGLDEYARYINEVTNQSKSVIYVESSEWNLGTLLDGDLKILLSFLDEVGAKSVMLGGGYVGRCLEDFYIDIQSKFGFNRVYLVPEITGISPEDLSDKWCDTLLTNSGRLNMKAATLNLKLPNAYGKQKIIPKVKNLPFYFYSRKTS